MRQPQPFFRAYTQSWYVTVQGKQIPLGRDEKTAWEKYYAIMASRQRITSATVTVAELCNAYLEWLDKHRSPETCSKRVHCYSLFIKFVGTGYRVSSLDGSKVSDWLDCHRDWAPSTGNDAVSVVQRAFNWAIKKGHLTRSHVQFVPNKPSKTQRETVYSPDKWEELRALVLDREFGDLLDFM